MKRKLLCILTALILVTQLTTANLFAAVSDNVESHDCETQGHVWDFRAGQVGMPPACDIPGINIFPCMYCGEWSDEELAEDEKYRDLVIIPNLGYHDFVAVPEKSLPPSCLEDGYAFYECAFEITMIDPETGEEFVAYECRETKIEPIGSYGGHVWDEEKGVMTVSPGCENHGIIQYPCSHCDAWTDGENGKVDYVEPTGHNLKLVGYEKEPTCTEPGIGIYRCTNEVIITDIGEYPDPETGEYPTYSDPCFYRETRVVPAGCLPADPVRENVVDATCTEDGSYDEVSYCKNCGKELNRETKTIPSGHTVVIDPAVPATCQKLGLTEGSHCSVCGEILVAQIQVASPAHRGTDPVIENSVEPTCTKDGSYDEVIYCEYCDMELERTKKSVPAHHTPEIIPEVPATCETTGWSEGSKCSACEEILVAPRETVQLAHKGTDPVIENTVYATCTEDGSYDEVIYCEYCDMELERTTKSIPAHHTPIIDPAVPATCKSPGLTEGSHCYVCEKVLIAQKETPKLTHEGGEAVNENIVEPTCTNGGSYDEVVYCKHCDSELSRETKTTATTGHTPEAIPEVPATCTSTGLSAGSKCSACDEILKAQEETPKASHEGGVPVIENMIPATDTTDGSYDEVTYCKNCNEELSRETKTIPAGCTPDEPVKENVVEPTCTTDGSYDIVTYCEVCKKELIRETIPVPAGHTPDYPVIKKFVNPTCAKEGSYDIVTYCAKCKAELSRETHSIHKLDHTPGEPVKENIVEPTATEDGSYDEVIYCVACKAELDRTHHIIPIPDPEDPTDPDNPITPDDPTDPVDPSEDDDPTDPAEPATDEEPGTGDDASIALWMSLAIAALLGIATLTATNRRRQTNK